MKYSLAVLMALVGCSKDEGAAYEWGSLRTLLESPEKVEAFRIEMPDKGASYTDWPPSLGPISVDDSIAKQFSALLLDPKSYIDQPKPCKHVPEVKLRWLKGSQKIEIVFCFHCSTLFSYSAEGKRTEQDFDPIQTPLLSAMKRLFPNDGEIQRLKQGRAPLWDESRGVFTCNVDGKSGLKGVSFQVQAQDTKGEWLVDFGPYHVGPGQFIYSKREERLTVRPDRIAAWRVTKSTGRTVPFSFKDVHWYDGK